MNSTTYALIGVLVFLACMIAWAPGCAPKPAPYEPPLPRPPLTQKHTAAREALSK